MVVAAVGVSLAVALTISPIMQLLARPLQQGVDNLLPLNIPPEGLIVTLFQRAHIDADTYNGLMQRLGYNEERAEQIFRASQFYPTPSDLVSWQAREVYEPDSIEKYGLDNEFEQLDLTPFFKGGMNREQALNFWRAHWQHPSFGQMAEMLHRDLLMGVAARNAAPIGSPAWQTIRDNEIEELYEWYRLVEVAPHWRDKLTAATFSPFTRVDIRRMWDLGVVDDEDVLRAYLDQGYDLEHARDLLTFTKVERRLPDLVQMYRNGWIEPDVILRFLTDTGISEARAQGYIQEKLPNLDAPFRVATERDLTKSEIVKGLVKVVKAKQAVIKLEQDIEDARTDSEPTAKLERELSRAIVERDRLERLITREKALNWMVRLGYDLEEAEFIIAINVADAEGSPETDTEFFELTEKYRKAARLPAAEITPAMREAERVLLDLDVRLKEQLERRVDGADVTALTRQRQNALVALQGLYRQAGLPPPTG